MLSSTVYDDAGNPTTTTVGGGLRVETSVFDAAGRLTSTTLDPAGLNRTRSFTYDANGNVESDAITDGTRTEEVRRQYDTANRLISETVENGTVDLTTTFVQTNNFSTSNLSALVLGQIEATVFQFSEVSGIDFSVDGTRWCGWEASCDDAPTPLVSRPS